LTFYDVLEFEQVVTYRAGRCRAGSLSEAIGTLDFIIAPNAGSVVGR
jgi:hypothetical protein